MSLAPGAQGKGCNFVNIKSHFCLQGTAWRRQKSSQGYPHTPFLLVVFSLLRAKQLNKPGAGLKSLEGSSLSPGHGLLILAAVLIAVNGFPFSYSLQTPIQAAFCGLCSGFPSHEKDNSKINRKTCSPHCISGVSQHSTLAHPNCNCASPHIIPSKGFRKGLRMAAAVSFTLGNLLPWKRGILPDPQLCICPAASSCLNIPIWGAIGLRGMNISDCFLCHLQHIFLFRLLFGYPNPSA